MHHFNGKSWVKKPVVNEIKELLTDAQSAVLVSYRGITEEQDTAMRKELREADVEYKVYKNTMIRFAIQGTETNTADWASVSNS